MKGETIMEKILSSKEMAKRIKANAKLNKKKIKKVVKKIFYYIEMEKIYNSSESESYDSEFWIDVFDEMLKSGMIDIDFLTNLKKYELVESYIKSECSIKSNDISLSGKKDLKEILDNELYTLAGYENTDDVYDKNNSSTDGEINTEDVYSKMKRIRIPEYLTYKEFEEYLCSDRVTKYLNPHDFWDMVCRETSYFDYEIKCHLKVFGNICDSFKKYTTSDFVKALKIFHNKIDTLVDYAEYHNTHGRSARQKRYPRKSSQYDELLSMATKGELSPLDISYITGFALRTITIDLNKKSQEK